MAKAVDVPGDRTSLRRPKLSKADWALLDAAYEASKAKLRAAGRYVEPDQKAATPAEIAEALRVQREEPDLRMTLREPVDF